MAFNDQAAAPEPIAIIGMACIFPQAPDLQTFWNNILNGVDAVGEPVASWDAQRYLDSGRIKTPFGGYLKELYRFDPREFGIMPNSMDGGEPDQFLALRVARDALRDAGYLRSDVDHRDTGIILGHSTYLHRGQGTVMQNNIALDQAVELLQAAVPTLDADALAQIRTMLRAKLPPTNSDTAPGLVPNVMTGRIANRLNLRGPNYLVDAACSSSLLAVSAAMDELRAGRSRLMLAGGVNASLPADVSAIFTQLGALSARGKVRPFEAGSDGTLLGEGLGVIVMKRLGDALADGDRVYAVLRGVGQASDGRGTGLLAPSVDGESLAIRRAYEGSQVDPATVSMIEAHGTGIPLGDKTEIAALKSVFGERVGPQGTIALGSVKSMISHCIPAAGIAGLIKTSLALHHRVLPPTLCTEVNPQLGIDQTRFYINTDATPWIAAAGAPRRAGVDSFGFGGINTHAIVEQAPASAVRPASLTDWPFELCVLAADSVTALIAAVERLAAGLARNPGWRLAEIAAALAAGHRDAECRLAFVAKDTAALAKALASALTRLREKPAARWSTRAGAFFSRERLDGQLAFMFPGEGSQYLGMFADLGLHFEEIRRWLDFWRGLYPDTPGANRTDIAYPPAMELTPERRKALETRLHQMDVGSEAVMIGGQAMFSLLTSLGVRPDVMVGHSSGESSALAASGALPADDLDQLGTFIRELNAVYQTVLDAGRIATGALLAVGALPVAMVHEQIAASGEDLVVAMDNCANQLVLYGSPAAIATIQGRLVAVGGICMPLPFDRGYHTPAFAPITSAFLGYYKSVKLAAPRVPLYSCASAERFPDNAGAVRKLAAAQWSTTVRFRETITRMHADGVRYFVEVGPSGNLTAFLGDILPEQPHLALATNQRRRHGMDQLLTTLAQLFVHGRAFELGKLFLGRQIALIDLDGTVSTVPLGVALDNTMPTIRLTGDDTAMLQRLVGASRASDDGVRSTAPAVPAFIAAADPVADTPSPAATQVADERAEVMSGYFDLMRGFLSQQHEVLVHLQAGAAAAETVETADTAAAEAPAADVDARTPFLDEILEHDAERLVARCQLSLHRDQFLRDHVLSGRGSATDPDLLGLACVPLMVSLEIMAEACAALAGSTALCSIEQVRAFDWIALDDGELTLDVQAEVVDAGARLYVASLVQPAGTAVTAHFRFEPEWRLAGAAPLPRHRPPRWDGAEIYAAGMFHGPVFQSLGRIEGWDDGGVDAELAPLNLTGFFAPDLPARMVLNPVLLDAMGQLAACWTAEYAGTDFNCFPSTIERIELYAACPDEIAGVRLAARQHALDGSAADVLAAPRSWSFDCSTADGMPLARVDGLVNVFFQVPNRFYQARRDPLNGWLGHASALWPDASVALWELALLPADFCAQSNAIFLRMLAHAGLSFEERDEWRALGKNVRHRRQWLLGRLCLKEAVRDWLFSQSGELVYPSDVVVLHDAQGAPQVDGWWNGVLAAAPRVSLSHNLRTCIAAVAAPDSPVGVDVEDLQQVKKPELLLDALSANERDFVLAIAPASRDEALLRLWCAKEAASKLLGTGLQGLPTAFEVSFHDAAMAQATVRWKNLSVGVSLARDGDAVVALADTLKNEIEVD